MSSSIGSMEMKETNRFYSDVSIVQHCCISAHWCEY